MTGRKSAPAAAVAAVPPGVAGVPGAASRFWLRVLFGCAGRFPWVVRLLKPVATRFTVRFSASIRQGVYANARRIFGGQIGISQCERFCASVVANFIDFICEVAQSMRCSVRQLRCRIESVEGHDAYQACRRAGGGAILVTAHMGSFEVGLAALAEVEKHIHVVFRRDAMDGFEVMRRTLRQRLGIRESPIDEGWSTWLGLRDALEADHVVVMQGDRAMPGQKAQAVNILGGRIYLPLGPVRLAEISSSPIVPVFTVRQASGRWRIILEPAIRVTAGAAPVDGVHPALAELGKVFGKYIAAYPDQWLMLRPAFENDS